ncbi:Squamous cell carcinoma antigen recognized by T-cells 3 [Lucilia cuprina]|nr:Squamous cell carcinoma antigen recognized by T-cells 3 [Lucilia cuprina]
MSTNNKNSYEEDIDEAEEEALLKSDDEGEGGKTNISLNLLRPPSVSLTTDLIDDNSLLNDNLLKESVDEGEKNNLTDADLLEDDEEMLTLAGVNKEEDTDDEDDDENDVEDEELQNIKEFDAILKELEVNQYAYDKYVRLCELSHFTGDLDNIRKAYLSFSSVYPLTPELWLKYIEVELVVAQTVQEIEQVKELFHKALQDYYSCDLALKFADFAQRCKDPKAVWQEILGTYGLNCLKGREFFKLYRQQFAKDLTLPEHLNNYIQSFLQELRLPLNEMEESYIEFKVYYERNKESLNEHTLDWSVIDQRYFKAKEHLNKIIIYEDKLKGLEAQAYRERAEVYFEYIKESDKFLDENVLQTLYERMVADCCLNAECWLKYIDFIDYRDAFGRPEDLQKFALYEQTPDDICKRALRNCTWSPELYIKRMTILEKMEKPVQEVQEVLETALAAGFQTPEPAVSIWLEYLTYLRRHTNWLNPDECEVLRKNFNLGWTILGQQWGVLADCNCEILQFWGRLEYGPLRDPKKGKELWNTVMESSDNSTKSALWMEFVLLEMRHDLEATRKLFSKALHSPDLDNPLVIASAWERFERCNGSIKTLNKCVKECSYLKQKYLLNNSFNKPAKTTNTSSKPTKRKLNAPENDSLPKQPKLQKPETTNHKVITESKESQFKEHENQEIDLTKDHLRIFLSNLDYNLTEDVIIENLPELKIVNLELIRSASGKSRGFGYAELETAAEVEKALTLDRKSINGRPLFVSSVLRDKEQRQKFKYNADKELHKLFIKSLPQDCNQAELEEIFGVYGKLKDVRLVYHKSGKFKQIAYVEYEQESSAGKAVLGTDNMNLRGHNISVAISAPPPKPSTSAAPNPIKMLGLAPKRKTNEQKPRMSLIPNVVRKNLNTKPVAASAKPAAQIPGPPKTKGENSLIKCVVSREHFEELLKSIKDKFIIVEFYAEWCGPCKILAVKFQELAEKYPDKLEVLKINIEDLEELAIEYEVNQMPSYMIMRNGAKLEQYFGSKPEQLDAMVEKYLEKSV